MNAAMFQAPTSSVTKKAVMNSKICKATWSVQSDKQEQNELCYRNEQTLTFSVLSVLGQEVHLFWF